MPAPSLGSCPDPASCRDAGPLDGGDVHDARVPTDASEKDGAADAGLLSCTGDVAPPSYVTPVFVAGPVPTPQGGPIQDGEYVLVSVAMYAPGGYPSDCGQTAEALRLSYTFQNGEVRLDWVGQSGGPGSAGCAVKPYAVQGASPMSISIEGLNGGAPIPYTAQGPTLVMSIGDDTCSYPGSSYTRYHIGTFQRR
jgi:hypothetical protein